MQRFATAVWNGSIKNGFGRIGTESATLDNTPYTFANRFDTVKGTNPEELIGAAHASCFTMMTTGLLGKAGFTADKLETKATVTFEQVNAAWTVTKVALQLSGIVPNITAEKFAEIAVAAKDQCPISRLLKAEISLEAKLAT